MKRIIFFVFLYFTGFLTTGAQDTADSLWNNANSHYANAQYQEALDNYLEIESSGRESAALYYNIGNTYYKMRYIAYAILYYEKALRLEPNNPDIIYNLEIAREQCTDRIEPVPTFFVVDWIRKSHQLLSSDMWAIVSVILLVLALTFFMFFHFARGLRFRKTAFILSVIVFLFAAASTAFAWQSRKQAIREDIAIVLAAVSSVKSAPGSQGKDLLVIHEGTRVRVLEEMGDWVRIELEDGRQGWVALNEIVFVY
ncbi:MAG: SH3 domain-containing protein [Bacteroidales bacterium]|jgi:tetratricopeptide (TPR) repeat protein|nr:SH3 domain-containing protein [Bacteroidales bacterium]MDD2263944.1 SH3 domain-containing protein [Bacteroidales bacterium]MDD2831178.1 SH3 domain-containing protein [Bacteroidales bacterium]MDD3209289.1 SH3 domain-containing protein [Bacteroidales bacterium]MDD3697584.1 SH3 domain-containing protein [Bacteroidales bacterium]